MKKCFVGFDTSNYTTSVAVCDEDGCVLANLKRPLPVAEGQRGLRQSDAVFAHIKNIPELTVELAECLHSYEPIAVGVSSKPRDAEGSYMPCFLSGVAAANAFAAARGLPLYEFSHQSGHIAAALYSANKLDLLETEQFAAFHVSGGTTEVLLVSTKNGKLSEELVAYTADINAGQAIDRVGVAMGLKFPCGAELEKLAAEYSGKIKKHNICVKDGVCNLSGAENIAVKIYNDTGDKRAAAAFLFDFIGRTLVAMRDSLIERFGNMPIIYAGGVMSNRIMRDMLAADCEAYFSEPQFSADNAAGIATLCRLEFLKSGKNFK